MNITTCTTCSKLYEESSEEDANAPDRKCRDCRRKMRWPERYEQVRQALTRADRAAAENDIASFLTEIRAAYHALLRITVELERAQDAAK